MNNLTNVITQLSDAYVIDIFVIGPLLTDLSDFTVSDYRKLYNKNILKDLKSIFYPENEGQNIKSVASSGIKMTEVSDLYYVVV
jgi:hypothetical protein